MNEQLIQQVVLAMARGLLSSDDFGRRCLYCSYRDEYYEEKIAHDEECPILLARRILREQGTPLYRYTIEWTRHWQRGVYRGRGSFYELTEDEALTQAKADAPTQYSGTFTLSDFTVTRCCEV